MTSSTVASSAPVTSWWYGQGGVVGVVRRLEALYALSPAPAAAGLVTARRDDLTVTFVEALRAPLPHPWHPADSGSEARIACAVADPGGEPDPHHPVYLVVFGTTDDGAVVAMNLAAFSRIRVDGDRSTAAALVSRWVLELLATHPDITVGVTADAWQGPLTARVRAVDVGQVPDVDVLICGPDLSYTDRAQIVSSAHSRIMVDLGDDAAVDAKWTLSCGPDRVGQISNGRSQPMVATLIVPSGDTVDRCGQLLTTPPTVGAGTGRAAPLAGSPVAGDDPSGDEEFGQFDTAEPAADDADVAEAGIDFFAPDTNTSQPDPPDAAVEESAWPWPPTTPEPAIEAPESSAPTMAGGVAAATPPPVAAVSSVTAPDVVVTPAAAPTDAPPEHAEPGPSIVAPLWNRLLGQVTLCPPTPGQPAGPREKRIHELMVYLQLNPWVGNSDIIRHLYSGAAIEKTVTQHVSLLRGRLGNVRTGGPKALPNMHNGAYRLDGAVRSDWMEFERLLEIIIEETSTEHLVAAMGLVTGPPLGGLKPEEWPWATNLRDEMRDRVAGAAVALARRHHEARRFGDALTNARKGLWYDTARQDLWHAGLQAALDGREHDAFKAMRAEYLNAIAGPDRDPAVVDLTRRSG